MSRCLVAATLFLLACSGKEEDPVERGRKLFSSTELSPSSLNAYSCASCHDTQPNPFLRRPGTNLAGATLRSSFWGGQENDLLRSLNACRNYFMLANEPLDASDEDAQALFEFLKSLEPGDSKSVPFELVKIIDDPLARGDVDKGRQVYSSACASCHGTVHTGVGRISTRVSILPEDTLVEHAEYSARVQRLIFIEKIRHGRFYGYGGEMPPFSLQILSDGDVSDVLEFLGITGQ